MRYLTMLILITGCVKSESDFITAPPGLTSAIYEQLIKIENEYENK